MISQFLRSTVHIMYFKSDCIFYACELTVYNGVRYLHSACIQRSIPMKFLETKGNRKSVELCLKQVRSTFVTVALYLFLVSLKIAFQHIRQEYIHENSEIRILNRSYVLIEEKSVT